MNDTHDPKKQSAFAEANPFLQLNKKAFPDKKDAGEKASTSSPARTSPRQKSPESDDAEAGLFLQAIQGIKPLEKPSGDARLEEDAAWTEAVEHMGLPIKRKDNKAVQPQTIPAVQKKAEPPLFEEPGGEGSNDFASAMGGVTPLAGKGRDIAAPVEIYIQKTVQFDSSFQYISKDNLEFSLHATNDSVEGHILGLDLITVGKLQAGQFSPEAHLDFHGLNALQAYQHLVGFMRNAYMRNQRTVLLVPGRGLNSPNGISVLRDKVQTWLTQEPFKRVVLAFCTAQPSDGGAGALYVLLRKYRKDQGKVQWDRVPVDPDLLMG